MPSDRSSGAPKPPQPVQPYTLAELVALGLIPPDTSARGYVDTERRGNEILAVWVYRLPGIDCTARARGATIEEVVERLNVMIRPVLRRLGV